MLIPTVPLDPAYARRTPLLEKRFDMAAGDVVHDQLRDGVSVELELDASRYKRRQHRNKYGKPYGRSRERY